MQERQVTAGGRRHVLPEPFFVLATQNPIEQEGTNLSAARGTARSVLVQGVYHLSETGGRAAVSTDVTTGVDEHGDSCGAQWRSGSPPCSGSGARGCRSPTMRLDYAMDLVRATRGPAHGGPAYIGDWVSGGAGPRAGHSLSLAAKARSSLAGRPSVSVDDIQAVALPVLRHRIVINYNAQAAGETSDSIVTRLLNDIPVRKGAAHATAAVAEVFRS